MARSPAKRVVGTLLFLLALVAVLVFYFLLFADAQQVRDLPGVDQTAGVAIGVAILLGIIAVILIALLAGRRRRQEVHDDAPYFVPPEAHTPPTPAFEEVDDDLVVYDVWRLPLARRSWGQDERGLHTFYFPLNVESGVYVNDYIPLTHSAGGPRLKLRTLLAGPPDVGAASFVIPQAREPRREEPRREEPQTVNRPAPAARRPERPRQPGEDFMQELERRFDEQQRGAQVAVAETGQVYYDFQGDNHNVIDVEGIGSTYSAKLQAMGIHTTARLCYEDAAQIAAKIGAPRKTVESWQGMAELMKISGVGPQYAEALVRSGIDGIDALKRRTPERVAEEVNRYLETLDSRVLGNKVTERRVASWQASAKAMRRVRQQVPDQ